MNRNRKRYHTDARGVPRTRGDEPALSLGQNATADVFPAHAGMNRYLLLGGGNCSSVPRTRGDEPALGLPRDLSQ